MRKVVAFVSYGQGGAAVETVLSAGNGTAALVKRMKALGVDARGPFNWYQYEDLAAQVAKVPADAAVIVGGTSLGANMAPWIAAKARRPVDLLFGIQPSLYGSPNLVASNVLRALCVYNPSIISLGFGAYCWQRTPQNHNTVLTARVSYAPHPGDNVETVQGWVLDEVRRLIQ